MNHIGYIPRNRLKNIPSELRANHEYCYFLHDQCAHMLTEYEKEEAHLVTVNFKDITVKEFQEIAKKADTISVLRKLGHLEEAKRAMLNTITIAMVSDCLHHVFEALKCFEKRKFIVAFNLLRKPLKDNLLYFAWMLGDEDAFYKAFTKGEPEKLAQDVMGNMRVDILKKAIANTRLDLLMDASTLNELLFDRKSNQGFELLFQHAVHLITTRHIEIKTSPENFNFIFINPMDNEMYRVAYKWLPYILLFLSHVIAGLFNKMHPMDDGASNAFYVRSMLGFCLIEGLENKQIQNILKDILNKSITCDACKKEAVITKHNAARILMTDSFRCASCRKVNIFPFSWII